MGVRAPERAKLQGHDFDPNTWICRKCGATGEAIEDNLVTVCDPNALTSRGRLGAPGPTVSGDP
jgi:hypothetical protein